MRSWRCDDVTDDDLCCWLQLLKADREQNIGNEYQKHVMMLHWPLVLTQIVTHENNPSLNDFFFQVYKQSESTLEPR